jgi:hypothetical protein
VLLAKRLSSSRQWTRQELDGGRGTDDTRQRCSMGARAVRGGLLGSANERGE